MQGARIDRVLLRRPDLRSPFPRAFADRLRGQTVALLTRRGKYLLAILSSGETLVMHLGMTGEFRIDKLADVARPRRARSPRSCRIRDVDAGDDHLQRSATVRVHGPSLEGGFHRASRPGLARTRAALRRVRRRCAGARVQREADLAQGRAHGSAGGGRTWQYLRQRSAAPSPIVAAPAAHRRLPHARALPRDSARRLASSIKAVLREAVARHESYRAAPATPFAVPGLRPRAREMSPQGLSGTIGGSRRRPGRRSIARAVRSRTQR